jgi:hypothetical protein
MQLQDLLAGCHQKGKDSTQNQVRMKPGMLQQGSASAAEPARDLTGLACGFAGFIGDAPVLTGAAGTASR